MVLLGDVDELEEERERPQHVGLPFEPERGDGISERFARSPETCVTSEGANPLLVVQQVLALLLDEHASEQVTEQAHVRAERCVGRHGRSLE